MSEGGYLLIGDHPQLAPELVQARVEGHAPGESRYQAISVEAEMDALADVFSIA